MHVMDGAPYSVCVGGELALTAHVTQSGVSCERHEEWATWDDLQTSPELKELMEKSDAFVATKESLAESKGSDTCA